ncbi:MAG: ABC transporter, substrate-binding protein (cluster 5, nickel/peptides/opines), partial [uncultured Thermomicrobiales bacterium]
DHPRRATLLPPTARRRGGRAADAARGAGAGGRARPRRAVPLRPRDRRRAARRRRVRVGGAGRDAEARRRPEGWAAGGPDGARPAQAEPDGDLARRRAHLRPADPRPGRPHGRAGAGRELDDLAGRTGLHLQAPPGRHVPRRDAAEGKRRQVQFRAAGRPGDGLDERRRPRLGRFGRGAGRRDGGPEPGGAGRLAAGGAGRSELHRDVGGVRQGEQQRRLPDRDGDGAVHLRGVHPEHPGHPGQEPDLLGGGPAVRRRAGADDRLRRHLADDGGGDRDGRHDRVRAAARHRDSGAGREPPAGRGVQHQHPVHRLQPDAGAIHQPARAAGDRRGRRPGGDAGADRLRPGHADRDPLPARFLGGAAAGGSAGGRRSGAATDGRSGFPRRLPDDDHLLVAVLVPVERGGRAPGAAEPDRDRGRAESGRERDDDRAGLRRQGVRHRRHRRERLRRPPRADAELQGGRGGQLHGLREPAGRRAGRPRDRRYRPGAAGRDLPGDPAPPAPGSAVGLPLCRQPVRGAAKRCDGLRAHPDRQQPRAAADLAGSV